MSNYPIYKPYIRFYDGANWQYYFYTAATGVDYTTTPTPLEYTPDGWKEVALGWQRGWSYKGIMRSYSLPLKFVFDGAKILRYLSYTYGIEANAEFMVEMWNPQTYTYSTLFRGDFDFVQFMDNQIDTVTITINESGFLAKLKAREDTPYQYRIDNDPSVVWLKIPSIDLQSTLRFSVIDYVYTNYFGVSYFPRFYYVDTEGTNQELTPYDVAPPSTYWFIRNHSASTFDVDIKIACRVRITTPGGNTSPGYFNVSRVIFDTNASGAVIGIASSTIIYATGSQAPGTVVTRTIDQTDTVSLSQYQIVQYSFEMTLFGGGSSGANAFEITFTTGEVKVYHIGATATSYIPALPATRVFELLVNSISDGEDHIDAVLTETTYNDEIYITSGDGIRNLAEPYLKTTMREFFEFFDSVGGAMLDYKRSTNEVRLLPLEDGFDQTQVLDVGEFKSCEIMPFTELAWVNLKIGGPAKTLDEVNGKDAVNMTSEFLSPFTKLKGGKDMVSTYVTEMYDIVLTMQNLTGKETTDADTDNDVIALHATSLNDPADGTFELEPSGTTTDYYDIYKKPIDPTPGANYWQINNVFAPEKLFNILFTPKRRLKRNGRLFRSIFYNSGASDIKFQMSTKNTATNLKMYTVEGAGPDVIDEGGDENIALLCADGDVLFLPYVLNVESKEGINLYSTIDGSPYKYITGTYQGVTHTIFILDTELKPADRAEWKIKGLKTPIDDPLDMIL